MARKRMISPEIWESQKFSELSDLAKIVFISLFSHADDEGRGRAGAGFIKNMTFPYDENRRVADIKQALSEIALRMSVQFYSVNGSDYYVMTHWERWQKVEKPSKSKLPPPPLVGEGGAILNEEKFPESSPIGQGILPESSPTNRIERNGIEEKGTEEVRKKVSNKKENLQSYDEIFDDMAVSDCVRSIIWEFIRHLKSMTGSYPINSRIERLIMQLDFTYGQDDTAKCTEVRQAIVNGYKRLPCEEVT